MKTIVMFDLDGTLAESKQPIDPAMGSLLEDLLENRCRRDFRGRLASI